MVYIPVSAPLLFRAWLSPTSHKLALNTEVWRMCKYRIPQVSIFLLRASIGLLVFSFSAQDRTAYRRKVLLRTQGTFPTRRFLRAGHSRFLSAPIPLLQLLTGMCGICLPIFSFQVVRFSSLFSRFV